VTSNKLLAKRWLHSERLPTPDAFCGPNQSGLHSHFAASTKTISARTWIIKPIGEHASRGIDDASIVHTRQEDELAQAIEQRQRETGCPHFAEAFVEGREFNLSLLVTDASRVEILPPAEIDFRTFPIGRPRIVGYRAKWDEQSAEYQQTPRRFDFSPQDAALLDRLRELSLQCWNRFGLRGYARVDFRVDPTGNPWILEMNTNPCLSPDAGFAAAMEQAGIPYEEAIARILQAAGPRPRLGSPSR
jgi:D-alanine-D-alanine ligase